MVSMSREQLEEQQKRLTVFQARYDAAFEPFNRKAEPPVIGQSPRAYRRENLSNLQRFLPLNDQWRNVSLDSLGSDALAVIEQQILNSVRVAATRAADLAHTPAARPDTFSPNMKMVTMKENGQPVNTFHGEHFVKHMMRPGRRVISFRTDHGYVDATGCPLR